MFRRKPVLIAAIALVGACGDPTRPTAASPGDLGSGAPDLSEARATNPITIIDLGGIVVDASSTARDINSFGVIVGSARTQQSEPDAYTHPMRWTVDASGNVVQQDLMPSLQLPAASDAHALAVNDAGTVVGVMHSSDQPYSHGFVLSTDGVIDVSSLPRCDGAVDQTNYSDVRDINNREEIVGEKVQYSANSTAEVAYSYYADLGAATPCVVQLPGMDTPGSAWAINDNSVIVGEGTDATGSGAIQWKMIDGSWTVSKLGRARSRAWSINLGGDVAGQFAAATTGIDQRALVWMNEGGSLVEKELGALGGTQSVANDVDDTRRVVGWAQNKQGYMRAFDWTPTSSMRDLGTLGGKRAQAHAVQGSQIVGSSELGSTGRTIVTHATLWRIQ